MEVSASNDRWHFVWVKRRGNQSWSVARAHTFLYKKLHVRSAWPVGLQISCSLFFYLTFFQSALAGAEDSPRSQFPQTPIAILQMSILDTKDIMVYIRPTSLKTESVPIALARVTGHQLLNLWINWILRLPFGKIKLLIFIICKEL